MEEFKHVDLILNILDLNERDDITLTETLEKCNRLLEAIELASYNEGLKDSYQKGWDDGFREGCHNKDSGK